MVVTYTYVELNSKNMYLFALRNDDDSHSFPTIRFNLIDNKFKEIDDPKLIYRIFDNLRHGYMDDESIIYVMDILKNIDSKNEYNLLELQSILFTGFKFKLFTEIDYA